MNPAISVTIRFEFYLLTNPNVGNGAKRLVSQASSDENTYIFSRTLIPCTTQVVVAGLFIITLLAPVVVYNVLSSQTQRTIVVVVATILLVAVLSATTKARTVEIFLGATA